MRLRTRIILVDEHYPALQKTQSIFLFTAQEHLDRSLIHFKNQSTPFRQVQPDNFPPTTGRQNCNLPCCSIALRRWLTSLRRSTTLRANSSRLRFGSGNSALMKCTSFQFSNTRPTGTPAPAPPALPGKRFSLASELQLSLLLHSLAQVAHLLAQIHHAAGEFVAAQVGLGQLGADEVHELPDLQHLPHLHFIG